MPEGQDPYGSFAYNQRIFKEMQCAINFRRTRNAGGMLVHTNNSLGGNGGFIPVQQFVLSNPITHVDRIVTPVLRSRIAQAKAAATAAWPSTAAPMNDALHTSGATCMPQPPLLNTREAPMELRNEPVAAIALEKKSANVEAVPTSIPSTQPTILRKPPLPSAPLPRLASAAPARAGLQRASINHFERASSAGSRRSMNSDFSAKVAALEATLQFERDSRLKVQNDLIRLERILETKLKQST